MNVGNRIPSLYQYLISLGSVGLVAALSYWLFPAGEYRLIGYLLLITVSVLALLFNIRQVLLAAVLSAFIWDFLFIPPHFTFRVGSAEDMILLLLYFVVALLHAVLTNRIRRMEKNTIIREEKEHTLRLYNTILNSLSHELRTPIATIIAASDNLENDAARLTAENRYQLVQEINKAALRLNLQVQNLLNMSRLETGVVQARADWCDIVELIYQLSDRVEADHPDRKIHISIDPDLPLFRLDKGILEQILQNILINAVTHTPAETNVVISAACYADRLTITIEDEGPGFPPDEIDQVFDKFYRLSHTRVGGTGLGLSIARGFTESLNGTITLSNGDKGGAIFRICLPAEISYLQNLHHE